ncbi:MAG: autotransporter outer membrane beta-barrel domain-containing protein [Pseudomonadota bacterium]
MSPYSRLFVLIQLMFACTWCDVALAQSVDPGPGLLDPRLIYASDVERAAAAANQSTFNTLDATCNPGGQLDGVAAPGDALRPEGCSTVQFFVYLTTRELVHSANALLGEGPTAASLDVDQRGLGTALRWTAAEELAVQGSMATQFTNNQLASLAARLSALRSGATGFAVANTYGLPPSWGDSSLAGLAFNDNSSGGQNTLSPWGGFLNVAIGTGDKQPTGNENAFDFDNRELTLGIDYRLTSSLVVGAMIGYSDQSIEFVPDANRISVVDGDMESNGNSAFVFGLLNTDRYFVSVSGGRQQLDYTLNRDIRYPSFNPAVAASNSRASSEPQADIVAGTLDAGMTFSRGAVTFEPYLGAEYLDVTIDSFAEDRSVSLLSGLIDTDAFNLVVDEQTFQSLDATLGARLTYAFTPNWGVALPYVSVEYHREFKDQSRSIRARYAGAGDDSFAFVVPTDPFDSDFFVWSVGLSSVIRGARQQRFDDSVSGGISAYLQYQAVEDLEFFDERTISAGLRYEF